MVGGAATDESMPLAFTAHAPEHLSLDRILTGPGTWLIGRDPAQPISIAHDSVSRQHARLTADGDDRWHIEDLGSKNGLRIDGRRVHAHVFTERTRLAIGDVYVVVEPLSPDAAEARRRRAQQRRDSVTHWALPAGGDTPDAWQQVLDQLATLAECERGLLFEVRGCRLARVLAARGIPPDRDGMAAFPGSQGAVARVLASERPVYLSRAGDTAAIGRNASVLRESISALAALPLRHPAGGLVGLAYLDTQEPERSFTELDGELLEAFSDRAAAALAVALLDERIAALARRVGP